MEDRNSARRRLIGAFFALALCVDSLAADRFEELQRLSYSDPATALQEIDGELEQGTIGTGDAQLLAARALYYQHAFRGSLSRLAQAEPHFSDGAQPSRLAAARILAAQNYYRMGSLEQSMISAREAERIAERIQDKALLAQIYNVIAAVYVASAEREPAKEYFGRALTLFESLGSTADVAKLKNNLGVLYIEAGELDTAERYLDESLAAARELGRATTIIANLVNLAELHAKRGEFIPSLAAVDECFAVAGRMDDGTSQVWCHEAAVEHYTEAGDLAAAINSGRQALALADQFELHQHAVDNARALSALLVKTGAYAEAQQMGELAITGMDQIREGLLKLRLEQVDAIRDYERAQAEVRDLQVRGDYAERQQWLLLLGLAFVLPLLAISVWLLRSKGKLVNKLAQASAFNRQLARTDALTELPNRRAFVERINLEHSREQREQVGYCVLLVDIDHFKSVNDRLGHDAGDQVLRHVAKMLSRSLRASDSAARWGGEEFVVLAAGSETGANEYANRLVRALATDPALIEGQPCPVTLSIGIACSSMRAPMAVIAGADAAMYQAKRAGRDRVCSEQPEESDLSAQSP